MKTDHLIRALGNPRKTELGYKQFIKANRKQPWAGVDRLDALTELKCLVDTGRIPAPAQRRGTNTHVHTNASFSIFASPSEAAWQGFQAGLDVLGINDHYTIGGHDEFRQACTILGLRATFSMEAVALSARLQQAGVRCNDPGNPGRTYLSAKGVMHDFPDGSQGARDLQTMRESLMRRNREIVNKLNTMLAVMQPALRLTFDDVLALTPHGNTTERHVCQALAELIDRSLPAARVPFLKQLCGEFAEQELSTSAGYQNMLRATLLKAGKPAYVEESPDAFISWERMIAMYREYGAIPSYPVLGNPVVELEEDLEKLFAEIESFGLYAIEVIPHRNTPERLAAILDTAAKHGLPVFNGTEHNTKSPMPLLDKLSASDDFIAHFTLGADVLIGHQVMSQYAGFGYLDSAGGLSVRDRARGLRLFASAGRMVQKPETLSMLKKLGSEAAARQLVGLHEVAPAQGRWSILARARMKASQLAEISNENGAATFSSPDAAERLKNWAEENVV